MRVLSRLIALAVSLALVAGGVLVAIEVVVAEFGEPWVVPYDRWYQEARENSWSSTSVRVACFALAAAGLVLLLLQVTKRRPHSLVLEPWPGGHSAAVRRRALERSLVRAVARVDGVSTAKARLSTSRARITATSNRRLPGDLHRRVTQTAQQRLSALRLSTVPEVVVRVHHRGEG